MTIYGWDQSHFDGTITEETMRLAKAQGIAFVTHKLGEGVGNVDPVGAAALEASRVAGIPVIGGYWFVHGDENIADQVAKCVTTANAGVPWWHDFAYWFWQADCETESGHGKPSVSQIKEFCDRLADQTECVVIAYASHGEYGSIPHLGHPLWNANYGRNPHGNFASVYPGDHSAGWEPYPDAPTFLQYGSNTTIAGKTTCDANAYRGTLSQLMTLIGRPDLMPLSDSDIDKIAQATRALVLDDLTDPATWAKIMKADVVPAPRPPYNDPDFTENATWQIGNALRGAIESARGAKVSPTTPAPPAA